MASHQKSGSPLSSLLPVRRTAAEESPQLPTPPRDTPTDVAPGSADPVRNGGHTGSGPRTTVTVALASLAAVTALQGTGNADPQPSTTRVKSQVDTLHQRAERATQDYNGARERAASAERRLDDLRDQAARKTERLNRTRNALGSFATAQYRQGSIAPGMQLALSSRPEEFLHRAALAERVGARQASAVDRIGRELRGVRQLHTEAHHTAASLDKARATARERKQNVERQLGRAERLLARLSAAERARVLNQRRAQAAAESRRGDNSPEAGAASGSHTAGRPGARADRTVARSTHAVPARAAAAGSRAGRALSFARGALGKPYVWGASGPSGYDCSGLTQAAWKAAGVSLPRTTYAQIKAGSRVARGQLSAGDLVFFYKGVTHVGLYVGGGKMIHAPRPGTAVKVAPISEMPYAGAVRPG